MAYKHSINFLKTAIDNLRILRSEQARSLHAEIMAKSINSVIKECKQAIKLLKSQTERSKNEISN